MVPATIERGYAPVPYHRDADETVDCPLCARGNDEDADYCDQCGTRLTGATTYTADDGDTVCCPDCSCMNDDDAEYCDQCGIRMTGREDMGGADSEDTLSARLPSGSVIRRENLVRARFGQGGVELRAAADSSPTELVGFFSEFNTWYEVNDWWEGTFLERVLPGAFTQTIAEDRDSMRVLFDHGMDMTINMKPLGQIRTLEERAEGPYYEVGLLDTDYNRDFIVPALSGRLLDGTTAGSQLGASFRFSVREDAWNQKPPLSDHNPYGLPERSIMNTQVFEFGPVTFPANPGASAGIRSMSGQFRSRLRSDPHFRADLTRRVGPQIVRKMLEGVPSAPPSTHNLEAMRRRARAIVVTGGR